MTFPRLIIESCWRHTQFLLPNITKDDEVEQKVEEDINSLSLEVAKVVSVAESRMNISHFLFDSSECDAVEDFPENDMIDFIVSTNEE